MARVKNTVQLIEKTRWNIDIRYDMSLNHLNDIINQKNDMYDSIYDGFVFGYAQSFKAAQSIAKRGKLQ